MKVGYEDRCSVRCDSLTKKPTVSVITANVRKKPDKQVGDIRKLLFSEAKDVYGHQEIGSVLPILDVDTAGSTEISICLHQTE
jgi:hypothetical protein